MTTRFRFAPDRPVAPPGSVEYPFLDHELLVERDPPVVVTRLRAPVDQDDEREAAEAATRFALLSHPSIPRVVDFGRAGEAFYVATEHVAGVTLRELRANVRLPHEAACATVCALAEALTQAHGVHGPDGSPTVHEEVCADNVWLSEDGRILMTGFEKRGMRIRRHNDGPTEALRHCWSPERVRGEPATTAIHAYGGGILLYELLAERPVFRVAPFESFELIPRICDEEPEDPRAWNPGIPADVAKLTLRSLSKAPSARPAVGEMAAALAYRSGGEDTLRDLARNVFAR